MNNCTHENVTIDRVCTTCGYDLIVEPRDEKIRKQEQDRIIRLLENEYYHYLEYTPITFEQGKLLPPKLTTKHADDCQGCYLIAAIKGEK